MIEVEAPDGSSHEFPDGTDQAVIKKAMAAYVSGAKPEKSKYALAMEKVRNSDLPEVSKKDVLSRLQASEDSDARSKNAPKFDILGDIGRSAGSAIDATEAAAKGALSSAPKTPSLMGPLESLKDTAMVPLSALGALASPVTGAAHALGGSALSYLPFMNKERGDEAVDQMMMGLGPLKGGIAGGPIVAGEAAAKSMAAAKAAAAAAAATTKASRIEDAAVQAIAKRMFEDAKAGGPTAVDALNAINSTTKPMVLADVGGENVRSLAGKVAREPGASRNVIKTFLDTRDADAGSRLETDIAKNIGTGSAKKTFAALSAAKSATAAPLYDEFYAANQNMDSPELQRIITTPAGKKALSKAAEKMANDRTLAGKVDPELTALVKELSETGKMADPNTGKGIARGLKGRTWDYIKRSLNDQTGAAIRAGEKDDARILTDLTHDLVNEIDKLDVTAKAGPNSTKVDGGKYAQARRAFSGLSKSQEALELGKDFFKPSMSPEQIAEDFAKLNPGDKEFYKLGVADEARARVARTGVSGDETKAIMKDPWMVSKLKAITDTPQQADDLIKAITDERTMFNTKYDVMGNSKTASRAAEDGGQDFEHIKRGFGIGEKALSGRPISAIWDAFKLHRDLGKMTDPAVNESVAKILTDPSLSAQSPIGQKLMGNMGQPVQRSLALSNMIGQRLAQLNKAVPAVNSPNMLRQMLQQQRPPMPGPGVQPAPTNALMQPPAPQQQP